MFNWESINKTYIYDNTFEGLLTVIFHIFETKKKPVRIVSEENFSKSFIDDILQIQTDFAKSERVINGILTKVSDTTFYYIYTAFLSCNLEKEMNILEYIILGFEYGPKIDNMLTFKSVLLIQKLTKQVNYEVQRFRGFVRFSKFNNDLFYAKIEPDNSILEMVGKHFTKRLSNQNFIIHDAKRKIALLYNKKEYIIVEANEINIPNQDEEENLYKQLWKTFFDTIAIKERTNKRLQLGYMPKRYWKNIFETEN